MNEWGRRVGAVTSLAESPSAWLLSTDQGHFPQRGTAQAHQGRAASIGKQPLLIRPRPLYPKSDQSLSYERGENGVTVLCHLVCPGLLMGCLFDCLSFWPQVCVLQCPLQSIWAAFPWGFTAVWVFLAAGCCSPCWLGSLSWMFDDGVKKNGDGNILLSLFNFAVV